MIKRITILISIALLVFIAATKVTATPTLPQGMRLEKSGVWLQNATETSGFVWNNELYYIYTNRPVSGPATNMKLVKFSDQSVISTFGTGYGCQDVQVSGSTLYVYATGCYMDFSHKGNSIVKFSTTDLTTWSSATTVKTADANTQYYNVSATYNTNTSEHIIAYESQTTGNVWATKFIASYDTSTWVNSGGSWSWSPPEIKYVNGYYYIWGWAGGSTGMTKTNLGTFTNSRLLTLKPEFTWEDINTTDLDLVEFDGTLYGFYMVGDQSTYMRLTYFTFDGSLAEFIDVYQQPN